VVYGIPVGFVVGAMVGVIVAALERPELITWLTAMLGMVIYVPIALAISKLTVKRRFESFNKRLVLHARAA